MIHNIHVVINNPPAMDQQAQARAALEQKLIDDHRKGKHSWGSMRRDCPLCQLGK